MAQQEQLSKLSLYLTTNFIFADLITTNLPIHKATIDNDTKPKFILNHPHISKHKIIKSNINLFHQHVINNKAINSQL